MKKSRKFQFRGYKLNLLEVGHYCDGTPALDARMANGEPYARLTACVDCATLAPGEYLIKDWSENEEIYQHLVGLGILLPTGRSVPTGYVEAKVCTVAWKKGGAR